MSSAKSSTGDQLGTASATALARAVAETHATVVTVLLPTRRGISAQPRVAWFIPVVRS